MSTTYGKAGWPIPALTDAPNAQTMIQAIAAQIDSFVMPKYASAAAQSAANPTPADGDNWYRTDLSQGYQYRGAFGVTLPDADSYGYLGEVLLGSTTTTIFLSAIPQTYQHLRLVLVGRSAAASGGNGFDEVYIRFNADSGSNYSSHNVILVDETTSISPSASVLDATNAPRIGAITNGSAGSGSIVIDIPVYSNTVWQKQYTGTFHASSGVGAPNNKYHGVAGGIWSSTNAITTIALSTASGSGFISGTIAHLYGYGS